MASTPLRGQWRQAVPCFWARRLQTAPFLGAMVSASWHATKIAGRPHLMFAPRFGCSTTPDRTFFWARRCLLLATRRRMWGRPHLKGAPRFQSHWRHDSVARRHQARKSLPSKRVVEPLPGDKQPPLVRQRHFERRNDDNRVASLVKALATGFP